MPESNPMGAGASAGRPGSASDYLIHLCMYLFLKNWLLLCWCNPGQRYPDICLDGSSLGTERACRLLQMSGTGLLTIQRPMPTSTIYHQVVNTFILFITIKIPFYVCLILHSLLMTLFSCRLAITRESVVIKWCPRTWTPVTLATPVARTGSVFRIAQQTTEVRWGEADTPASASKVCESRSFK